MRTLLILCLLASPALAHSWYPPECCSGRDCMSVRAEDMQEVDGGCWKYLPTGAKFCGAQVRPSQDKNWHVCISAAGFPYCAFIQTGM